MDATQFDPLVNRSFEIARTHAAHRCIELFSSLPGERVCKNFHPARIREVVRVKLYKVGPFGKCIPMKIRQAGDRRPWSVNSDLILLSGLFEVSGQLGMKIKSCRKAS